MINAVTFNKELIILSEEEISKIEEVEDKNSNKTLYNLLYSNNKNVDALIKKTNLENVNKYYENKKSMKSIIDLFKVPSYLLPDPMTLSQEYYVLSNTILEIFIYTK